MILNIHRDQKYKDLHVDIKCPANHEKSEALISVIQVFNNRIQIKHQGEVIHLDLSDIYYFDYVDRKTFCYTKKQVYESNYKLYEIENLCKNTSFVRCSKRMIVDVMKITSFKTHLNGRLLARLTNDEVIEISRSYANEIKKKMEVMVHEKTSG